MSNEERIARYKNQLETYLREFYEKRSSLPQSRLFEAMQYSLMAGGKRLRPVLAMEFCRLCGGDWDALLTDAFMVAATAHLPDPKDMAFAIETLAECAGSMGMVGGQALDIASGERELTEQEVIDIQTRKTGALIHAACVLGAIVGGGSEEQIDAAARFAEGLGMAFQIRDDMLDVIGTQQELGKGIGTDETKNTFVRLYGLEACEELVQRYTGYALDALEVYSDTEFLSELAGSLTNRRV